MPALVGAADAFGGVVVDPRTLPATAEALGEPLGEALARWLEQPFRLAWLEIPAAKAALLPAALEAGFGLHHTDTKSITLVKRLQETAVVPPFATHHLGAGGVVLSEAGELLVVREGARQASGAFKLPGGLVERGERVAEAVVREVLEETGVETTFVALAGAAHVPQWFFGMPNLYLICRLTPRSYDVAAEDDDIVEARWLPLARFLDDPAVSDFNKGIVRTALGHGGLGLESPEKLPNPIFELFTVL